MNNSKRRVVVTGIGLLTPLGLNVKSTWDGIVNGKSGISQISRFDTSFLSVKIAGNMSHDKDSGFDPEKFIEPRDVKKMDLFIQYGIAAAVEAVEDSGIQLLSDEIKENIGVILGSGIGGLYTIEQNSVALYHAKTGKTSPFFIPASLINLLSGHVSIKYGLRGPNNAVCTACATGGHAIGDAYRMLAHGYADIVVAGSAESAVTPLGISGFASAKALTTKFNDNPEKASRPWDKDRDGFVISEGAGVVVLEEYEHAKNRGAKIYAEVIGYGMSGDAHHITSPHPDGIGAYNSVKRALNDAQISAADIGYINAHGTSTPVGDAIEIGVIQRILDEANTDLSKIRVSSTKSAIGHSLGAAGAIEAIFCMLALRDQIAPPTLNLDSPMDEVRVNLVPHTTQEIKGAIHAMTNSFGFGGTNAVLILKKI